MSLFSFKKLSLKKKGILLILVLLLLQIMAFVLVFPTIVKLRNAQKASKTSQEVISTIAELTEAFLQARGAFRSYLISNDNYFKDEYEGYRQKLFERSTTLSAQAVNNEIHIRHIQQTINRIAQLSAEQDKIVIEVSQGLLDKQIIRRKILSSKIETEQVLDSFNYFFQSEKDFNNKLEQEALRLSRLGLYLIVGLCLLVLISAVITGKIFDHCIAKRFAIITDNILCLSEGRELTAEMKEADEIGQLDRAFHNLSNSLRDKVAENETFVYGVSHDLRSPLVNLQGFGDEANFQLKELQRLLLAVEQPSAEIISAREIVSSSLPKALTFISTATNRISTITSTLLTLSRTGKKPFQWQMVNVAEIIRKIVDALDGSIREKGAEVEIDSLTSVYGDPSALEQIFSNLLVNAIKYLDPVRKGKVSMGIDWSNTTPERYTFYIKDNGLGIPAEFINSAFKPFKRFHPYVAEGEGIGLSIVERLVKKHFGKIWLESEAGVGTTFYISFLSIPLDKIMVKSKSDFVDLDF